MMSETQDPKEWFDQFDAIADEHGIKHRSSGQFCWRHWAPAPLLGANGIGWTVELMQRFVNNSPECKTPEELNTKLDAIGHVCCHYGDIICYQLWGEWGPSGKDEDSLDA